MRYRPILWAALGLMLIAGLIAAHATGARATARASLQDVAEGLTCQCGCGLTVANCNMPTCGFAVPMRRQILAMIGTGKDRAGILSFFRHQYGEKVLSAPTWEGFNILAWVMPFIAVATGGGLIVIAVGRWHHQRESSDHQSSDGEGVAFDPDLRRRLERDLRQNL